MKAAAIVFAALLAAGCNVVVGDGSYQVQQAAGASDGGPPVCTAGDGASACHQCLAEQCCAEQSACTGDCESLASCESTCTDNTCISQCEGSYPDGVATLQAYLGCSTANCSSCSQAGIGDPCSTSNDTCAPGLICNGTICTQYCSSDADCAGAYDDGKNGAGTANVCAVNGSNESICFPGCTTTADCARVSGTTCVNDTLSGGGTGMVCATGS